MIARSQRGCVINTSIANATARALIQRFPQESTAWARSQTDGIRKASKVPDAARKEIKFQSHHEIVTYVEKFKIPPSLILNLDQTPLKYVPVSQETMAPHGSTAVTIEGSND